MSVNIAETIHPNQKIEREKALIALEIAKKLNRPVKFLKKGESFEQKFKKK